MPFDLNTFSQEISQHGVSMADKFDFTMTLPPIMQQTSNASLQTFTTMCPLRAMNCTTPGMQFMGNESYKVGTGPRIFQPYNARFIPIKVTLLADEQGIIEQTLNQWMGYCFDFSFDGIHSQTGYATFMTNYRSDVMAEGISINKYNRSGNVISTYTLADVVPMDLQSENLDWNGVNSLVGITMLLHYTSYTIQAASNT